MGLFSISEIIFNLLVDDCVIAISLGMSTTTAPVLIRPITDAKAREDRRRLAVQRVLEGETQTAVAKSLKVTLRSVQYWMRRYRDRSEAGLQDVKHPGPQPKLSADQERTVCSWITKDPTEFGFRTSLWTAPRLVKLIREKFGIVYNSNYFCTWLHKHGFTPQKPRKLAAQRDEAKIAAWPKREWPAILKKGLPKMPTWC
jgi:transposase